MSEVLMILLKLKDYQHWLWAVIQQEVIKWIITEFLQVIVNLISYQTWKLNLLFLLVLLIISCVFRGRNSQYIFLSPFFHHSCYTDKYFYRFYCWFSSQSKTLWFSTSKTFWYHSISMESTVMSEIDDQVYFPEENLSHLLNIFYYCIYCCFLRPSLQVSFFSFYLWVLKYKSTLHKFPFQIVMVSNKDFYSHLWNKLLKRYLNCLYFYPWKHF